MKNTIVISLVVLAVIGGLVYASLSKPVPESKMGAAVSPTTAMVEESAEPVQEITVEGSKFKFEPSTITVKKGQKVKLIFKNIEGIHDFRVDELGIATEVIEENEQESVEFTADKIGSFEFYCSVEEHRAMGMVGTLVVEE